VLIGGSQPRMLKLTARFADMWNITGSPEDAHAGNERMDAACLAVGRDPGSLVRTVSPSLNLLASVEAFEEGVAAYHAAGVRDIYMPWPRVEAEVPVLRQVARDVLPKLRGEQARASGAAVDRNDVLTVAPESVKPVLEGIADETERAVLGWLIDHPDERFDGAALQAALGVAVHRDVTRAVAGLGAHFLASGLARPWNEAQKGYLMTSERATLLRSLR
jgi:alkanesulfonate monooxygenase SsuD/methylene tetrahydromethanopterin reductase-like flavin-dependent oxidoreductase (luciferase family)